MSVEEQMAAVDVPAPSTMRAARVHEWGDGAARPPAVLVEEIPVPLPGEGESLVRVDAATVSHLDLTVASGSFGVRPRLPYVGGVEGAGTVVASSALPPGTRVVLRGSGLGLTRAGTWAEYVAAPDDALLAASADLDPARAATFMAPSTTARVALMDVARLGRWPIEGVAAASDEVVVVTGASGSVGAMAVQLAMHADCTVLGLVGSETKVKSVPECSEVVVAADTSRVAKLAEERSATVLIDTVGGPAMLERSRWVRPGGRAAVIGYLAGNTVTLDVANWMLSGVALLPVNMIAAQHLARAYAPELARQVAAGDLDLAVTTFPLRDAAMAIDSLSRAQAVGRVALLP